MQHVTNDIQQEEDEAFIVVFLSKSIIIKFNDSTAGKLKITHIGNPIKIRIGSFDSLI